MLIHHSLFIILLGTALLLGTSTGIAAETDTTQKLLGELRVLTEKSRQQRAADRWLQRSLEDLIAQYDWPWQRNILFEDFSDGDFTQNPEWQVVSGQFQVLRGQGLFTRHHARKTYSNDSRNNSVNQDDLGGLLVGALLDRALGSKNSDKNKDHSHKQPDHNEPGHIRLRADVSNAFALSLAFRLSEKTGSAFSLSLMQSESAQFGYRLHIESGVDGVIELQRIRRGRGSIIDSKPLSMNLNDARLHDLDWRQTSDGTVTLLLDDKVLFEVRDRAFRDGYPWLEVELFNGDLAVRSLRIDGI